MGLVYLGTSPGGRKVAIKVVHPHYASDPKFRSRFAREVAAARQVGGFHTAAVLGADPDAESPWMATAYIPGPSLDQAIARRGPLDEAGVRKLGAALAEGLAAIHGCGLIHRDLKPSNVILADDGPRIIDFGIAKGTDTTALTSSQVIIGTLRYMSPEQLRGRKLTPASDIFALGTVLAHAATGHDPFDEQDIAVVSQILNDPPDLSPLTGHLRDIISACLAKDPGERPGTAGLLARLNHPRAASEPARDATPEPVPEQVTSPTLTAAPPGAIRPQSPPHPPATLSAGGLRRERHWQRRAPSRQSA
jgi:serine/threonine protein kinase